MKNNLNNLNAFLRFSFVVLLFSLIIHNASAQLSLTSSGQQLNNLAGRGVVLDDFNGDNKLDAFVVNEDGTEGNGYRVYFGDGTGQFTDSDQILHNPYGGAPIPDTIDLNGDDRPEVITGRTIWINDGQGAFSADTSRFPGLPNVEFLNSKFVYINNDSLIDVFTMIAGISGYVGAVFINNGQGKFTDSGQRLANGIQADFNLGNLNSDDFVDVVITGWRNVNGDPCPNGIWINDGTGNFTKTSQNIDEGMRHVHASALGDIDNDGDKDLILGIQTNSPYVKVFKNDGTGKFTSHQSCGLHGVEDIKLADMDNDGDSDLVLACNGPNEVWLNDGDGNFNNSNLTLGSQWSWGIDVGDFNNDNKTDIFAVNMAFDNLPADPWYIARGRLAEVWLNTTFICDYFGETPPGNTPEVFALDVISKNNLNEHCQIAISPKGDEIYWSTVTLTDYKQQIYYTKKENETWTEPALAEFINSSNEATGPSFSPDGEKMFFKYDPEGQGNIMFVVRTEDGWSDPIEVGEDFNSQITIKTTPFFTNKGNAYCIAWDNSFNNNRRALRFKYSEGKFSEPTTVIIHPDFHPWGSIYVSPDEDYLIFDGYKCTQNCSDDTYSSSVKLYICFKDASGNWGYPISTGLSERYPVVSPDGKYLFFAKTRGSTYDFYWVSTSIIDDLKQIALSISDTEKESTQYEIFPNPASQTIQIKAIERLMSKANYKLIDLKGKTIKQGKLNSETIDISELPKGIYMLRLNTGEEIITEKIVVE